VGRHVSPRPPRSYPHRVQRYLVEVYMARIDADTVSRARAAAGSAADGSRVRFLRATFIPSDETWLLFYSATSAQAVAAALERVGLDASRVVETA
jgi:hypothetical protein